MGTVCIWEKLQRGELHSGQRGAVAILFAICLIIFIGFGALAIDIGHLYVAKNELQNAADAGALAGARFLYNSTGTLININANQIAKEVATANKSENISVEVNEGDVQRGHWTFVSGEVLERGFHENSSTAPTDLWGVSEEQLDQDRDFINAVEVIARRDATPVSQFFARIFLLLGMDEAQLNSLFQLSARAVAYIGFSGKILADEVDQPIAICKEAISDPITGDYSCNTGKMFSDGKNSNNIETAAWTNFQQADVPIEEASNCPGAKTAAPPNLWPLVDQPSCEAGKNPELDMDYPISLTNGTKTSVLGPLYTCWENITGKQRPWTLKLPVIICDESSPNCGKLDGTVVVHLMWIADQTQSAASYFTKDGTKKGEPVDFMEGVGIEGEDGYYPDWSGQFEKAEDAWTSFVEHFHLKNPSGEDAEFQGKTLYLLPDCTPHPPSGGTGGSNHGVLAKIPVLVD